MKISKKESGIRVKKFDGTNITYFLFDGYEIHYNELDPGSIQSWHHHKIVWETIYTIEGELTLRWKEKQEIIEQIVRSGDVVEVEDTPHSFANQTQKIVKFIVIKQVLSGKNNRELFKKDKVVD